jgi:hypothetical protein
MAGDLSGNILGEKFGVIEWWGGKMQEFTC